MTGLEIDSSGDVVIESGDVQTVEETELLCQTIEAVLSTNKGEWFLNGNEGITFQNILGKGVTDEIIYAEIKNGLNQVDEDLYITDFEVTESGEREVTVNLTISDGSEQSDISVSIGV